MKLKIVTPEKLILEQEADSVTLPGTEGEMTILPTHAAMTATLKAGKLTYRSGGSKSGESLSIGGGFVEVYKNHVLVITSGTEVLQTPATNPSLH
ncbi:MAG: ATP synthase F1 subunit epsilon [Deltaproteobacteria bacterium]|nr:ATP synthase F1 subunit epsilon [Deltaproteobacteria bacterium]